MKNIKKYLSLAAILVLIVSACTKVADLPYYDKGQPVTLTASKTAVTATPADSVNPVIAFNWTDPNYKQDSLLYKFVLEIDSTGRNFAKKSIKIVTGAQSTSLTGRELNNILLTLLHLQEQQLLFLTYQTI